MKKILFPTDFSKTSLNAFVYALHLAKKINAEIITIHVYQLVVGTFVDYHDFLHENYSITEWSNFENYKSEVPKLRMLAEQEHCTTVKVSHILQQGDVVADILKVAQSERVDFIVMGTTGASGLKETFLGSIAEKVLNQSKAIVLAIPGQSVYKNIKNILFLTELNRLHIESLKEVECLALAFNAHIDVLQIKSHHEESDTALLEKWKKQFLHSDIYFYILTSESVEDTAADFMELNKTDIVAMPVHEKNIFEKLFLFSLSRQMAFHAHVPVLAVHVK